MTRWWFGLFLGIAISCSAASTRAEALLVFAAASLKSALDEATQAYETGSDTTVTLSFAGTSTLARQIDRGAPADVIISANVAWMDWLGARGHIDPASQRILLGNRLVVIAPAPAQQITVQALPQSLAERRLAVALVKSVPAGQYAKAALATLGLWQDLEPRLAQTDNVRAALALVASGAAPFGITYATDAIAEPRVDIVARIPDDTHPAIRYPMAKTRHGTQAAQAYLNFLQSDTARQIFDRHGFVLP